MALTGFILVAFVFVHMVGNLKLYLPDDGHHLNEYAEYLREIGAPILMHTQALWMFRIVLLAAFGLHILTAFQLWFKANAARSKAYNQKKSAAPMFIGQMMRLGGIVIGGFVVYHILHFTTGTVHPNFEHGAVYANVIKGFQDPVASGIYIAAMVALGLHIFHGGWSLFQTLGLNNRNWKMTWKTLAALVAAIVMVANISFPVAVLAGIVTL